MTAVKLICLWCDAPRCIAGFQRRAERVENARRAASCEGWRHRDGDPTALGADGGQDYCPDHAHLATDDVALQETSR